MHIKKIVYEISRIMIYNDCTENIMGESGAGKEESEAKDKE